MSRGIFTKISGKKTFFLPNEQKFGVLETISLYHEDVSLHFGLQTHTYTIYYELGVIHHVKIQIAWK